MRRGTPSFEKTSAAMSTFAKAMAGNVIELSDFGISRHGFGALRGRLLYLFTGGFTTGY